VDDDGAAALFILLLIVLLRFGKSKKLSVARAGILPLPRHSA
jgi:hypothetical protein